MQKFKYVAVNLQKQKIKGIFIAKDERDLAAQLAKQSLFLLSAKPYSGATPSAFFTLGTGKVSVPELTTFCRQFSIMLNTNIPILDCLDVLKNQSFTSFFKSILAVIYEDVKSGILMSDALAKHAKVFPNFFRSMVKVGEVSGKLDEVFVALADYYETDIYLKRKLKSAMSYPILLLCMTFGIAVLMLAFVVPKFRETLNELNVEPEGLTAAVYAISDFILAWWRVMVIALIGITTVLIILYKTPFGSYAFDVMLMKLPLIRTIMINLITSRFAKAFALLLSSGMDLNEALYATEIVIGNKYLTKKFHAASDAIRHGMSITNAFESYNLFPPMMIQMIMIGERTNSLDDVLLRSCKFFDTQVETSVTSISNKIQPIILLFMAVVVILLFIATYSPMLTIMTGLSV